MDATHGATAPSLNAAAPALNARPDSAGVGQDLSPLSHGIREYSLFQGVLLALDRLRALHPGLDEQALYERLDFQANPSLGFPGSDIDTVEFFEDGSGWRARLRLNLVSLFGAGSPLPAFYADQALGDSAEGNPRASFSTCSTTACNACCCRFGRSTATTPVSPPARAIRCPNSCSPSSDWAGNKSVQPAS